MAVDLTKKLALHAAAYPELSLDQLIGKARQLGCQALHLRLLPPPGGELASDVTTSDPEAVRGALAEAGLALACLETGIALHYRKQADAAAALRLGNKAISLAGAMGAEALSLHPGAVLFGERPAPVVSRIAERCRKLCEHAEMAGVQVLFENVGYFARSKPMWELVETTDHERCGVCWNAARAAPHGERPAVSLNALNFRIRLLKLQDGVLEGESLKQRPLGEGDMRIERLLQIASGIGYDGFLSLLWDRQAETNLASSDQAIGGAAKTIFEWMRPKLDKKGNPLTNREAKYLEVDPEEEKRKAAEKAEKAKAAAKAKAEAAAKE